MRLKVGDNLVEWLLNIIVSWYLLYPLIKALPYGEQASRGIGLLVVFFAFFIVLLRGVKRSYLLLFLSAVAFLLNCLVRIPVGHDVAEDVATFIRILGGFVIFFAFLTVACPMRLIRFERRLFILGAICALYTLVQASAYIASPAAAMSFFGLDQYWGAGGEALRPRGLLMSIGGSASLMSISLLIYYRWYTVGTVSRLETVLFFLVLAGLASNFTRTFILCIVIFIFLHLFVTGRFQKLWMATLGLVLSVVVVTLLFPDRVMDRLSDIPFVGKGQESEEFFEGRFVLAGIAWDAFASEGIANYIFGNGLNFSSNAIMEVFRGQEKTMQSSTHNDVVWLLVNLGVVGTILYSLFLCLLLQAYDKHMRGQAFYTLFVIIFFFLSSLAGESINISGHRYIQYIYIALLLRGLFVQNQRLALNYDSVQKPAERGSV
ncbi:O-antigen ligase family protein [Microbulbifer yueqingensis]|uniref:O-Antigen ligase n=1 Tax=Microbulbifer yueqingensis TaxID=658219 RepID=A0A1G8VLJ2_9GAMM|nr:O-antigen ligase family protein [Microbulbifer yueqingensis]SDJ66839.1 O-Antigen ligase [Microbulbifer yueqingensis]